MAATTLTISARISNLPDYEVQLGSVYPSQERLPSATTDFRQ
ncbi:hypothetical protein N9567_09225 [Planktomarina temperata]|nr:hypothetical protein [Planktomarina temperata]MDA8525828.1 hypothetical protein [Planktomarina temperata]MDA8751012.1 hypothetical protein [Planktomarina temperata]MDA8784350.1 hypothetical protein [Planktomarina temperata]MDA8996384.1 hypothetical protein [Planktomarina temperata]